MASLYKWRMAVVGPDGPESPTTRHVLLTLSLHMNKDGGSCFPSIATLANETQLSGRSVITHLDTAAAGGWILREYNTGTGQAWKRGSYTATMPKVVNDVHHEGSEASSPRSEKGGEPDDKKVVKEVHTSSSVNSASKAVRAVEEFCTVTGAAWKIKAPIAKWADSLAEDYPGINVPLEVRKATEWWEGKSPKNASRTIRNWLDRARPTTNGKPVSDGRAPLMLSAAELREREGA